MVEGELLDILHFTLDIRIMSTLSRSILGIVLTAIILLLLVIRFPDSLVNFLAFHPNRGVAPAMPVTDSNVTEVSFEAVDGVQLQAFHVQHHSAERLVLFFHGNAGSAFGRLPDARTLSEISSSDVLLLSYRGYGNSDGSPSESGVYQDAEAALQYATEELGYSERNIFVLGRSLGSAVAVNLAQHRNFAGIILVSPFTSGRDMASQLGLGWLSWVAGKPFDSIGKAAKINVPALFIHGDQDTLIPLEFGRRLYEAYPSGNKEFKVIQGAGHNNVTIVAGPRYWEWMRSFMNDAHGADSD